MDGNDQITWHLAVLPRTTQRALDFVSREQWLKKTQWYLAGGTALALQVGHRSSYDLDFFLPSADFATGKLLNHFKQTEWETDIVKEGTIYGRLLGAKVSFIAYPFFKSKEKPRWYGNVRVLDERDIAVMKIIAISQRGKKRDFVDLYWYSKHREPLEHVLRRLPEQYPTVAHNYHHILKALIYFADAEQDQMPAVRFSVTWNQVKRFFEAEVPRVTKNFLGL